MRLLSEENRGAMYLQYSNENLPFKSIEAIVAAFSFLASSMRWKKVKTLRVLHSL